MTDYRQQLEVIKNLEGAIASINDLRNAIVERGEELPQEVRGNIYFAEGMAYWKLCRSPDDCQTAVNLYDQAIENNPDLELTVNGLFSIQPCECN